MTAAPQPQFNPLASAARASRKVLALSLLGLAVFLAWQALALRSFIGSDTRPPSWDQANHLEIALDYRQALKAGRWADALYLAPKPGMPPFPPLYHLAIMRAYDHPNPVQAALWANWFYLALLCLSLFAIIYEFQGDSTALAGVVIFACTPAVQELLRTQLIDLAVVAIAAASYWALIRSDDFTDWLASLAFGALYAVGMMYKWSFFSYMLPAYFIGLKALSGRKSRVQVLAAALVALAGFGPWYYVHLPVLIPRLFQATSDFAIPVWQGGAFFTYLLSTADSLGPLFWALAWIGLVVPNYKRNLDQGWIIPAWVVTSYLFWAIVPNRQIRFLLPGLPGLAMALCGAWPPGLIWAVFAVQLFTGINYAAGWISPINLPLPFIPVTLLPTNPPAQEDWKIADILREAEKRNDPASPLANLTLVANAPYFNGPNFTWLAKYLRLSKTHMRGVNVRLCEFSQFVVLKNANLGPAGVISGLPEASKLIQDKESWFPKAYEKVAQWPLPDGTQAWLYQQRRLPASPFRARATQFQFYESGPFSAADFKADLGKWDSALAAYPLARVSASSVQFRGLKASRLALELENLVAVPAGTIAARDAEWDDLRFLKLGRLKINSASVTAEDLRAFLEARVKGLRVDKLELDKTLKISATFSHFSFSAELAAELKDSPRRLLLKVLDARVGVTPIPTGLLSQFKTYAVSLEPNPETPFYIDAPGLTIAGGRLSIP